jgi:hypothetical protein
MHITHPFRRALAALAGAAAMFAVAGVTNKGHGAGWTDGTQAIANLAWISMIVLALLAGALVVAGAVLVVRERRA